MNFLLATAAESVRMLSFLTVLGFGLMGIAPLVGCDQKPATPVTDPVPDQPNDIKIQAPGVDIEVDRTPRDGDAKPEVDVDVLPGTGNGVDVDVERTPGAGPAVDVDVERK